MASGQDIRITDVPFSSVPATSATVFINDNGRLRQTDLTTIAKYSELYTAIIEAHNAGLQSLEATKAQLEQALTDLANEKFETINKDHAENLAELTALYENSMQNINALIENGHTKLLNDIAAVDDLRASAATVCEAMFTKHTAITPTVKGNMLLENIKGSSYQKQLSGKNLLDEGDCYSQGLTYENGTFTSKSNSSTSITPMIRTCLNAMSTVVSTYDFDATVGVKSNTIIKDDTFNMIVVGFRYTGGTNTVIYSDISHIPNGTIFTVSFNITVKPIPNSVSGAFNNVQLELGSTATPYEPYCGGMPSPNPDYPQEIESVGDSGSVVVKTVGKNLLKNTATTQTINGVTFTVNSDGSVTANGTASANAFFNFNSLTLGTGTYIMSGCPIGGVEGAYAMGYHGTAYDIGEGVQFELFAEKTAAVWALIYSGYTADNLTFYPMIRKADVADATYQPYTESTITIPLTESLRAIGDVKDEICVQDGKYGVLRRIKEVVFNGSEDWTVNHPTNYSYGLVVDNVAGNGHAVTNVRCDKLIARTQASLYRGNYENGIATWDDYSKVYVRFDTTVTTVDLLKAKLADNPITVDYELATPVFEPFDDQTPFYALMAYDEVTNISIVCSDNLNPSATVMYPGTEAGALLTSAYVAGKVVKSSADVIVNLLDTAWELDEATGMYVQTIAVKGVTHNDTPVIGLLASDTPTSDAEVEAYAHLTDAVTGDGTLTLYADEALSIAINIVVKGINSGAEATVTIADIAAMTTQYNEMKAKVAELNNALGYFKNLTITTNGGFSTMSDDIANQWSSIPNSNGVVKVVNGATLYHGTYNKYSNTVGSIHMTDIGNSGASYVWYINESTHALKEICTK